MLRLYTLCTWLLGPMLPLWLRLRLAGGKEDPARLRERFGHAGIARPEGPLIWIHAASVGEALSAMPLAGLLAQSYPRMRMLLTTVTVTSARLLADRLPERALHQFAPLDHPRCVDRFLAHWKPDFALWVESELWPNAILRTRAAGCPMALVNGRMSDRSFRMWRRFRPASAALLRCFSPLLAQSAADAGKLRGLGGDNAQYPGNLKFDAPPLPAPPGAAEDFLRAAGGRQLWLAASTHPGEEEQIAAAHLQLRERQPGLLTVIAPRHARRGPEVAARLAAMGLGAALRSRGEAIAPSTDIYIADTMGELGLFYRVAGIAFIGGSLVPHGGQNPLEAARLGCAVICGPNMENFAEICAEMEAGNALLRVADRAHLAVAVEELLRVRERRESLARAALAAVNERQGALSRIAQALAPSLAAFR